jgi:WD40 repeat protein
MTLGRKGKLLAVYLIPLALLTALLGRPGCGGLRLGGEPVATLTGHRFPVQAVAFGPGGATLTSAAYNILTPATVEITDWDVGAATPAARHTGPLTDLRCLALAPDGRTLAAAGGDGEVWLWDTDSPHARRLCAPPSGVCALAFAPDGRTLASGGWDFTIRLWDVATGGERETFRNQAGPVPVLAFAPDSRALAGGGYDGVVRVWDVGTWTERAALAVSREEIPAVAFDPRGGTLAVGVGPAVELWDVVGGRLVAELAGHARQVKCLAFSPDGTRLASGSHDRTVRLWDVTAFTATSRHFVIENNARVRHSSWTVCGPVWRGGLADLLLKQAQEAPR